MTLVATGLLVLVDSFRRGVLAWHAISPEKERHPVIPALFLDSGAGRRAIALNHGPGAR